MITETLGTFITERPRMIRHRRVRKKVHGVTERPRLAVFRSSRYIYAQVIDDSAGQTLVSSSSLDSEVRSSGSRGKIDGAAAVGASVAKRAIAKGINTVVFDRAGYKYHGRVRALADAAREEGLKF